MKATHWTIAAAAFVFALPAPADAIFTDPEIVIYRFPGVLNTVGAGETGVATSFHCTNFSGTAENIRIVIRDSVGAIRANTPINVGHLITVTLSTKPTALYVETAMGAGAVNQGTAAIAATSVNVICTAVTHDASSTLPSGFALRGIRFNPVSGSQE